MLTQASDLAVTLVDALRSVAEPERVILFGSLARGQAHEDSDIDLLVVAEKAGWRSASRRVETARLRKALPRVGRPIDVLLYTPAEVDKWRQAQNHVVAHALREGVVLYERP